MPRVGCTPIDAAFSRMGAHGTTDGKRAARSARPSRRRTETFTSPRSSTGGPAATAGIKVGDIVAGLVYHGEEEVDLPYREYDGAMFDGMIRYMTPGEKLTFKLRRGSETLEVEITIAAP